MYLLGSKVFLLEFHYASGQQVRPVQFKEGSNKAYAVSDDNIQFTLPDTLLSMGKIYTENHVNKIRNFDFEFINALQLKKQLSKLSKRAEVMNSSSKPTRDGG